MTATFDIRTRIAELCDHAAAAMHYATDALLYMDLSLIDDEIDSRVEAVRQCAQLRADAHSVLAAHTPVANDLRCVLAAINDVDDLERMEALSGQVARIAHLYHPVAFVPSEISSSFLEMARSCVVIGGSTKRFVLSGDSADAAQITADVDAMTAIRRDLFTIVRDAVSHGTSTVADTTLLSRYYERFSRHAINIANRARA